MLLGRIPLYYSANRDFAATLVHADQVPSLYENRVPPKPTVDHNLPCILWPYEYPFSVTPTSHITSVDPNHFSFHLKSSGQMRIIHSPELRPFGDDFPY